MKTLTTYLKENHPGKKFMDIPSEVRNNAGLTTAARAATKELCELYGADELYIYARKGISSFSNFTTSFSIESLISIFEVTKERITHVIPRHIAQAIVYKPDPDDSEDMSDAVAAAMSYALKGIPPEYQEMAYTRMQKAMEKGGLTTEDFPEIAAKAKKGGEDELLEDLLK